METSIEVLGFGYLKPEVLTGLIGYTYELRGYWY